MANVLFTNVRILDATGTQPYAGEVLVQGNRIARVGRGPRSLPQSRTTVIDGAGATLMPGMVEAHTHFGWTNSTTLDAIQKLPHEEHTLWAAQVAKQYLDCGWTSCVGAATPKPRLDCVIRNAIDSGGLHRTPGSASSWAGCRCSRASTFSSVSGWLERSPPETSARPLREVSSRRSPG